MECRPDIVKIASPEAVAKTTPTKLPIRIRGKATDLYAPQGSDAFQATDKATISYAENEVKHQHARTATGVVGVELEVSDRPMWGDKPGYVDLVPYWGIASNITKTPGTKATVPSNSRQVGAMVYGYSSGDLPYYLTLRPDYLWNLPDKSRLFTANVGYVPVVLYYINSAGELGIGKGYWFQWIVNGKFIHGRYVDRGEREPQDSRDFDRFGGEVGFQLDHAGSPFPWSWKVGESYVHGRNGVYRNLAQLKSTFSISLDEKKMFGLDFSYTSGRDVETAEKDQSWKISLGLKY